MCVRPNLVCDLHIRSQFFSDCIKQADGTIGFRTTPPEMDGFFMCEPMRAIFLTFLGRGNTLLSFLSSTMLLAQISRFSSRSSGKLLSLLLENSASTLVQSGLIDKTS